MFNAIGIVVFLGIAIVTAIRFVVVASDQDYYHHAVGKKEYLIVLGMLYVSASYIVVDLLHH